MDEGKDFIVSELLSELKEENKRKDIQIKNLHRSIIRVSIAALIAVLIVISVCFIYLSLYDFSSTDTLSIEKSAEGMFAMVDSNGNVIGDDTYGESDISGNQD